ncbi:MAG: hypothetical protein PHR20_06145 [Bacteroidales bacterium]|nr:hypothetical protein [Bacteroidales bacterium]
MKKLLSIILLVLVSFLYSERGVAQNYDVDISKDIINIPYISFSYAYQFPLFDMADRFGSNSAIGVGFTWKTNKNLIFGLDWSFMFSGNVDSKDTLLQAMTTTDGLIISQSGLEALVSIYERGNLILFKGGKLFPKWGPNENCGLFVTGGLGLLMHKIKIEVYGEDTPQLNADYRKGYDRFSIGPAAGVNAGYMFVSNNGKINFKAELECYYGLTHSIRPYNFDTMSKDIGFKNDFLIGLKVSWLIPFYPRKPQEYYFE